MSGYYKGKIKVVGVDMLCFPVDRITLKPLATGVYDPYAWSDTDPEPIETISCSEWHIRRNKIKGD